MFVIPLMPTKHLVLLCPLHLASLGLIKGLAAVWHLDFKPYVGIHDTACYLTCLYIVGCTGLPDRTNTCKPYASARHECNPKKPNCKLCRLSNFPDTTNCNMFTTVHTADWTHWLQVWSPHNNSRHIIDTQLPICQQSISTMSWNWFQNSRPLQ